MSKATILKHYARIIELWPKDVLRPSVTFQNALRRRKDSRWGDKPGTGDQTVKAAPTVDPKAELAEINALYHLLDNNCQKRFPVSKDFYRPRSNPEYYEKLVKEMEVAPTRSRFGRWLNSWKGFIRLS